MIMSKDTSEDTHHTKPEDINDLEELLDKVQTNLLDDVDDLDDQISELKGILNETLGDLPFKFAIVIVVFLNFLYTSYDAFFAARIGDMITDECYCDPTDQTFYRAVMFLSTAAWISFLFIYGVLSTCGRKYVVCSCNHHHEITPAGFVAGGYAHKIHNELLELLDVLKKRERKFRAQLRELVTTKFLDEDHCESIRQHYYNTSLYGWKKTGSDMPGSSTGSFKTSSNPQQSNNNTLQVQDAAQPRAQQSRNTAVVADIEQPANTESGYAQPIIPNASQGSINHEQATNGQDSTAKDNKKSEVDTNSEQVEVVTGQNNSDREQKNSIQVISRNNNSNSDIGLAAAVSDRDSGLVTEVNKKIMQKPKTDRNQSQRWLCFMFLKVTLIGLRFVFRFLIVPLLQLQLFSDYAWYCLLNNVVRNYCQTETNKYYIGLDHSLVNYCVYILLLIALLFSFLINWFPKGIPQVVLLYKAGRIIINKKGMQFGYMTLVNEPDNEYTS